MIEAEDLQPGMVVKCNIITNTKSLNGSLIVTIRAEDEIHDSGQGAMICQGLGLHLLAREIIGGGTPARREEYWVTRRGNAIAVGDMDIEHVRNTLRMLIRKRREKEEEDDHGYYLQD